MTALAEKQEETVPHTFTLTVQIELSWIELTTKCSDLFRMDCVGYWLRGVEFDVELGWLCWEDDERRLHGREPNREAALKAWRAGDLLPEHWFRLDRAAALRAWEEGVKRWGVDWYEDADSASYDTVVQIALLGEERYG